MMEETVQEEGAAGHHVTGIQPFASLGFDCQTPHILGVSFHMPVHLPVREAGTLPHICHKSSIHRIRCSFLPHSFFTSK